MQNNNILSPLSQFNYIDVHGADSIDGDSLMEELIRISMDNNTPMETLTYIDIEGIPYTDIDYIETLIRENSYIEKYTIDDYIETLIEKNDYIDK